MAGTKAAVTEVEVAGHSVRLSSPDRVIFPQRGFTKADVFHYYLAVGDGILRALRDRPTTLQRYPEGITGESFYQKRAPPSRSPTSCAAWAGSRARTAAPASATSSRATSSRCRSPTAPWKRS